MFSPELMSFLIKYQSKEYVKEEKPEKNDETEYSSLHRFTKYATVPVTKER